MERDVEKNGVLQVCEELGIGFVPWGPLGMGYLTGTMDARHDARPQDGSPVWVRPFLAGQPCGQHADR